MLQSPLPSIEAWLHYLSQADLSVLKRTARELARLRENEENVNGRQIAGVILQDPLMTLRVLAHMEVIRTRTQVADITTLDRAVMMLGVTPFFKTFEAVPLVEDTLADYPLAMMGLLRLIARSRQASLYARDWAVLRHDPDAGEIAAAALLHDSAELMLWCFAPTLMTRMHAMLDDDPTLRSVAAQEAVLNIRILDLQLALARAWHLPQLLQQLMDDARADDARVRNVELAVRLARHSAKGWDNPALPDDIAEIVKLVGISREALLERIGRISPTPVKLPDEQSQP